MLFKTPLPSTLMHVSIRSICGKNSLATSLVAAVFALLLLSGPALSTPNDVIVDYRADGSIDATYSADDLFDALTLWKQTGAANYGDFDDAVSDEIDRLILGVERSDPSDRPPSGEQQLDEVSPQSSAPSPTPGTLPTPPPASAASNPPFVFLGLTALAAVLLLAGIATALARRLKLDQK